MQSLMKCGSLLRRQALRRVRIEDLEEVAKALPLGFVAKLAILLRAQRRSSSSRLLNVTLYRPRFAPRARSSGVAVDVAALDVVERGRAERPRRLGRCSGLPRTTKMSVVSLARAAGVTWLLSNSRS